MFTPFLGQAVKRRKHFTFMADLQWVRMGMADLQWVRITFATVASSGELKCRMLIIIWAVCGPVIRL